MSNQSKTQTPLNHYIESADSAMVQKDWPQAIRRWQKVFDALKDQAPKKAYIKMCGAYRQQGLYDEAEEIIIHGMQKYPKQINCYIKYAEIAMDRQDWPEAVRRWQKVFDGFQENIPATAYVKLSLAHRHQNQLEIAEEILNAGLEKFPANMVLLEEYGHLLFLKKDWQAAAKTYELICTRFRPNVPLRIYQKLVAVYKKIGNKHKASQTWKTFCSTEDLEAENCYYYLLHGRTTEAIQNFASFTEKVFTEDTTRKLWLDSFITIAELFSSKELSPLRPETISLQEPDFLYQPYKKILVSGMGWSGSGALFDFFREFADVYPIKEELRHIEGIPGLNSLNVLLKYPYLLSLMDRLKIYNKDKRDMYLNFVGSISSKIMNNAFCRYLFLPLSYKNPCFDAFRRDLLKFFGLTLLGYAQFECYADYKKTRLGKALNLSGNGQIYARGVHSFCRQIVKLVRSGQYKAHEFNRAASILLDAIARAKGADKNSIVLFNNIVHTQNVSAIEFLDHAHLFCTFRGPRSNYVARIHEDKKFVQNVQEYISSYKKARYGFQKLYNSLNHNKSAVHIVQFEKFVLSESYRNELAASLGLDLGTQEKYKYFQPWVSEKNVFLHETYENQDEIKAIEDALGQYCVDVHKLQHKAK